MKPSRLLLPLVPLYAAAVAAKNAAYASRLFQPNRLAWPVISVGNLSTGGAGKTPFVLALNKLLAEGGWLSDVLTRGHGRQSSEVALVDPAGDPARFSDEPLLLARNGLRVYVARDRIHAGCLAERESAALPRIHILDDGLQHRSLARDIEIILLLAADLRDHLLPAGNLREPLSALRRADVIVLREEDAALAASLRAHLSPPPCIWIVRRALQFRSLDEATAAAPANALAFCAIARPDDFFVSLSRRPSPLHGCRLPLPGRPSCRCPRFSVCLHRQRCRQTHAPSACDPHRCRARHHRRPHHHLRRLYRRRRRSHPSARARHSAAPLHSRCQIMPSAS